MELLRVDQFQTESTDRVFREPALGHACLLLFFGACGVGFCALPILVGAWGLFAWLPGSICLLAAGLGARGVLGGLLRPHWVVRVRDAGIALHLRSYLNADLPLSDEVVLWIPRSEVAALRPLRRKYQAPSDDGDYTVREALLEIALTQPAPESLRLALERERAPADRRRTHHKVHLVRQTAPDRIEVTWRSPRGVLRPGLKRFLAAAELDYTVAEPAARQTGAWRELDAAGFDDLVLELCEGGDLFTAVRLLRKRHGWSLVDARRFVDELTGGRRAA